MWSVLFLLLSYLDRDLVQGQADNERKVAFLALSDTQCAKSSILGQYIVHQVSDGVEEVRSVRDASGQLLRCSVTANASQVASFMRACTLGLRGQKIEPSVSNLKLVDVSSAKASCAQLSPGGAKSAPAHAQQPEELHPGAGEAQTFRRSKRGFTYPGTLWCGAGNIADDYDQLGEFTQTDSCCRTHDYCPHVIHAFSNNYGYTNFKWHSISHCDCDNALKACLKGVNDTSSRVVGQAFFNVIEVPCFELSYEEQCVERHWYGVCKRYDKVPIAVIRESVPYDFGGIDVIDVLTLAPPKKELSELDQDKQEKAQSSESTTQSSFSGSKSSTPEEPSLTNVVTAAEDFIKVLATVSTSQSSSADSGKGEAQTSEKKRKKNAGKKKKDSKKRRGKGKGKKRKQNTERVSKAEDGVAGAPSNRTEEVINKEYFVEDPGNFNRVSKNGDNLMNGAFDALGDGGHSNKMMRDEYQRIPNEGQSSGTTTTPNAKQKDKMLESLKQIKNAESAHVSNTMHTHSTVTSKSRSTRLRQRAGRKRYGHLTPTSFPLEVTLHNRMGDNTPMSASESSSQAGQTTHSPISLAGEEVPRNSEYPGEKGSAFTATTQNTPIVGTKRQRLSHKGGRKRSRKLGPLSSPIQKDIPNTLTAEETSILTTDTTQELTSDPCPHPQSVTERLQQNRLVNLEESSRSSTKGTSGEILPKKRHQKLKGTKDRKRPVLPNSHSTKEDTHLEDRTTTVTFSTAVRALTDMDSQSLFQLKNAESTTGQLSLLILTTTPTLPLQTKMAKRRSKERHGEKGRKNKVSKT